MSQRASHTSPPLQTVPGVGAATAETIESFAGVTSAHEFYQQYLTLAASALRPLLHSTNGLPPFFLTGSPEDLGIDGRDIGLSLDAVYPIRVMGFIRTLGCTENSLIDDAPTSVDAETVLPEMVNWGRGWVSEPQNIIGFVFDEEAAMNADTSLTIDSLTATPETVTQESSVVTFVHGEQETRVSADRLARISDLTGIDFTADENLAAVRMDGTELSLVQFDLGNGCSLVVAPLTQTDDA